MRAFLTAGCALAVLALAAPASTRIDLNGQWQFCTDPDRQGAAQGWSKQAPGGTDTVRVPHTWNVGKHETYVGRAWYFKTFSVPRELVGQHAELHLGATFYCARVWLNGVELGSHEGGHTAWFVDATRQIRAANFVAVEINNTPGMTTIPGWAGKSSGNLWYDWWHYGGIVRDAWLQITDSATVRRQEIRTQVAGDSADVTTRIFLENHTGKPLDAELAVRVFLPEGGQAQVQETRRVSLGAGANQQSVSLKIPKVKLWHFDTPHVYRMQVDLSDARGNLIHSLADNFGARTVEIRDLKLYLNGEPVRLSGMARHQDSPWEGLAESSGTMRHDYDDMKSMHMTLTRPVHYPQHPEIMDYCDRNGILLIPEIPMWQFGEAQMRDPKVIALAERMMRELIEQNFNHPSVWAWSVCNESETNKPGGVEYVKRMVPFVKKLDPERYVSYADDRIAVVERDQSAAPYADFIMMNQYFGSWHGPDSELGPRLERVHRNFPDKMVLISEFGLAGFFVGEPEAADRRRVEIIRHQMATFSKYPWISGALFWCYADYRSHRNLWPGEEEGYVEMGLLDENRQRRPSYYAWKEWNEPARIAADWRLNPARLPEGFHAAIERRRPDEIPSYSLRGYRLEWEVRDDEHRLVASDRKPLADIGPPQQIEARWAAAPRKSLQLKLRLIRPNGFVAAERSIAWRDPISGGLDINATRNRGIPIPN